MKRIYRPAERALTLADELHVHVACTCISRESNIVSLFRVRKRLVINLPPCYVTPVQQQPTDGQLTVRGKGLVYDKNKPYLCFLASKGSCPIV